jgi:hypothetical protein
MNTIKVGDVVVAQGRRGRFSVLQVRGMSAEVRCFGETESGERVDARFPDWLPLASLAVIEQ